MEHEYAAGVRMLVRSTGKVMEKFHGSDPAAEARAADLAA
jgi:hypothetical protein